ncbi:hypothetical protein HDV00_003486 [Rhizophlyctis rosea]|nr:hypothetical protein HDV00_003486 [Rhizophlyctis rosea]
MLVRSLFATLAVIGTASAATIAELVTQNANIASKAAAAVSSHPEWAQAGRNTLFIPTDAALTAANLPAGDIGALFTSKKSIDYRTTTNGSDVYLLLEDDKGVKRAIWDDYTWGPVAAPDLHVRTASAAGTAVKWLPADNGFLYILNVALPDPAVPSVAAQTASQGNATTFFSLAKQAGIDTVIDGLKNVTIWAPSNAAFTAAQSRLASLSNDQLAYVLYYHITQKPTYSNLMSTSAQSGILQGTTLQLTVGAGEGNSNIQGARLPQTEADLIISSGVMQIVGSVIIPTTIPTGKPQLVAGVQQAATTTTAGGSTQSQTASSTASGAAATQTVASKSGVEKVVPGVMAAAAVVVGAALGL